MKAPAPSLWTVAVIVIGAFAVLAVAGAGYQNTPTPQQSVTNESIIVEYDAWQQVDAAQDDAFVKSFDNETVRNSTGATLTEGTDYEYNASDGTIIFLSTSSTTEGNTGEIDYDHVSHTDETQRWHDVIAPIVRRFPVLILVAPVVFVVGILAWGFTKLKGSSPSARRF